MTYDWVIWKARVTDATVRFLHIDDVPASGFASVYRFAESDARSMEAAGTFAAFRGTVFSDTLKLDFDTESDGARAGELLRRMGVGFCKYSTGGRGFHYHIPREAAGSHLLPALDKRFVAATFPGADVSFYHHVGLYRQEGAIHAKTGKRKVLVERVPGPLLQISMDTSIVSGSSEPSGLEGITSIFADTRLSHLAVPHHNGGRHKTFCAIAARLRELGQPTEWAYGYMYNVNLMCETPLTETEIQRILDWAYGG